MLKIIFLKKKALHLAAHQGYLKIVNGLLQVGAKLNRPNANGLTALSYLVRIQPENDVQYRNLIQKMINEGANVNSVDK